jgi:hypothetical protein
MGSASGHLRLLCVAVVSVLVVAGCGGSDSTTATVPGTTVGVPGTTVEVPAASSVVEAATSIAAEAGTSASSVADDIRQRLNSSLPGLEAMIDGVDVNETDGTVTVRTSLRASDTIAGVVKDQCATAKQALGGSTGKLIVLGADGDTIASC